MAHNPNFEELLHRYFEGQLSEKEIISLNDALKSDPSLKQEFDFQTEVVRGLKNYRKQQLKMRLESVKVPGSLLATLLSSNGIVATVATTIALSGSVLLYNNFFANEKAGEPAYISFGEQNTALPEITPAPSIPKPLIEDDEKSPILADQQQVNEDAESVEVLASNQASFPTDTNISIQLPSIPEELTSENNPETDEIKSNSAPEIAEIKTESDHIEVATLRDEALDFHYKFSESKLYLYGSYDSPYEIIELIAQSEKKLFFNYEGRFYFIRPTIKPLPLIEITDPELVNELEVAKSK